MKEAIKRDILKCLDNEIIYSISDSSWVSQVYVVSKKFQIIVIKNDADEVIVDPKVTLSILCVLMITNHIKAIWY